MWRNEERKKERRAAWREEVKKKAMAKSEISMKKCVMSINNQYSIMSMKILINNGINESSI